MYKKNHATLLFNIELIDKDLHRDSESGLFLLIAQGDTDAFKRAYAIYKTRLTYFVSRWIDDPGETEDIISEVFFALWKDKHKIKSDVHLRNFLYLVARNRAINYLESKERHDDIIETIGKELSESDNAPADEVQTELLRLLHKAVKSLPQEYARVFELAYYNEFSPGEISRILNINPSTVRTQKQRALQMIKDWIAKNIPSILGFILFLSLAGNFSEKIIQLLRRCALLVCINHI